MSKNMVRFSSWAPQVRPKSAMRLRPCALHFYGSSLAPRVIVMSRRRPGHPKQYLTHTHRHISWAVAAMDSCACLAQISAHQHGIANHTPPVLPKHFTWFTAAAECKAKTGYISLTRRKLVDCTFWLHPVTRQDYPWLYTVLGQELWYGVSFRNNLARKTTF